MALGGRAGRGLRPGGLARPRAAHRSLLRRRLSAAHARIAAALGAVLGADRRRAERPIAAAPSPGAASHAGAAGPGRLVRGADLGARRRARAAAAGNTADDA